MWVTSCALPAKEHPSWWQQAPVSVPRSPHTPPPNKAMCHTAHAFCVWRNSIWLGSSSIYLVLPSFPQQWKRAYPAQFFLPCRLVPNGIMAFSMDQSITGVRSNVILACMLLSPFHLRRKRSSYLYSTCMSHTWQTFSHTLLTLAISSTALLWLVFAADSSWVETEEMLREGSLPFGCSTKLPTLPSPGPALHSYKLFNWF